MGEQVRTKRTAPWCSTTPVRPRSCTSTWTGPPRAVATWSSRLPRHCPPHARGASRPVLFFYDGPRPAVDGNGVAADLTAPVSPYARLLLKHGHLVSAHAHMESWGAVDRGRCDHTAPCVGVAPSVTSAVGSGSLRNRPSCASGRPIKKKMKMVARGGRAGTRG